MKNDSPERLNAIKLYRDFQNILKSEGQGFRYTSGMAFKRIGYDQTHYYNAWKYLVDQGVIRRVVVPEPSGMTSAHYYLLKESTHTTVYLQHIRKKLPGYELAVDINLHNLPIILPPKGDNGCDIKIFMQYNKSTIDDAIVKNGLLAWMSTPAKEHIDPKRKIYTFILNKIELGEYSLYQTKTSFSEENASNREIPQEVRNRIELYIEQKEDVKSENVWGEILEQFKYYGSDELCVWRDRILKELK